jgi:hypothetical protein
MTIKRLLLALALGLAVAGSTVVPDLAMPAYATGDTEEKQKCNSGRGNQSEGNPDCDPGNSGGHNQGGD